jgi:uncharacterized protein (TIGR02996 family)
MNEELGFLRAIEAQPTDKTARLVYADWLDERSDPRGLDVRMEVELLTRDMEAADILGSGNVHGLLAAKRLFGNLPRRALQQLVSMPKIQWESLESKEYEEHLFVSYFGHSIVQLRDACEVFDRKHWRHSSFRQGEGGGFWFDRFDFAFLERDASRFLLPRDSFSDCFNLPLDEQIARLSSHHPGYFMLSGAEFTTALLLHDQDTNQRLTHDTWLRCGDLLTATVGDTLSVGAFGSGGLSLSTSGWATHHTTEGVAAARRL